MPRRQRIAESAWSVYARLEEVVLASSGVDAFELVFALAAARLFAGGSIDRRSAAHARRHTTRLLAEARRAWPGLDPACDLAIPDATLLAALELLDLAALDGDAEGLDALFEQLLPRVSKGNKGQFFTPRHVVDFAVRTLGLRAGERFVDPACGSGAFVAHARAAAAVDARGLDLDARAVRVAKLLMIATGGDPATITRADSLARSTRVGAVDAIATNPPFAGAVDARGFELGKVIRRTLERDALFVERCLSLLRPGGRLAIVLPYGKVAAPSWADLRRWLLERARVFAVVSLPRETFLPHTSQRTALVFARKRERPGKELRERVFLAVSEEAGRDARGEPVARAERNGTARITWRDHAHDLGRLERPLQTFLARERFA